MLVKGMLTLAFELIETMKGTQKGKDSLKELLDKHPEIKGELDKMKKMQEA